MGLCIRAELAALLEGGPEAEQSLASPLDAPIHKERSIPIEQTVAGGACERCPRI